MPSAAAQDEGGCAGRVRGELQAAGGGEAEAAGEFADNRGEAAVSQAFLHHEQHFLAGLSDNQPVGVQPDHQEPWAEWRIPVDNPQHRACQPCQQAGDEHCGHGGVASVETGASDLVERSPGDAPARERSVDSGRRQTRGGEEWRDTWNA